MDTSGARASSTASSERKKEEKKETKTEDSNCLIQPTHDPIRDNCRKLLQKSLGCEVGKYSDNQLALMAARCEGKSKHCVRCVFLL